MVSSPEDGNRTDGPPQFLLVGERDRCGGGVVGRSGSGAGGEINKRISSFLESRKGKNSLSKGDQGRDDSRV